MGAETVYPALSVLLHRYRKPIHLIMRVCILLLSALVILAVLSCAEAKKKKEAGPCKVKECQKCNITGKKCKVCNTGFKPKQRGRKCKPKPCFVNPCQNGGICSYAKKKKQEKCACPDGYSGDRCQTAEKQACEPNPCANGGSCSEAGSGFTCTCATGYTGDTCTDKVSCIEHGYHYIAIGNPLVPDIVNQIETDTPELCQNACQAEPRCNWFTWRG